VVPSPEARLLCLARLAQRDRWNAALVSRAMAMVLRRTQRLWNAGPVFPLRRLSLVPSPSCVFVHAPLRITVDDESEACEAVSPWVRQQTRGLGLHRTASSPACGDQPWPSVQTLILLGPPEAGDLEASGWQLAERVPAVVYLCGFTLPACVRQRGPFLCLRVLFLDCDRAHEEPWLEWLARDGPAVLPVLDTLCLHQWALPPSGISLVPRLTACLSGLTRLERLVLTEWSDACLLYAWSPLLRLDELSLLHSEPMLRCEIEDALEHGYIRKLVGQSKSDDEEDGESIQRVYTRVDNCLVVQEDRVPGSCSRRT
jgi:hypothetical protein